jgi:flagellar assembly factor FliW
MKVETKAFGSIEVDERQKIHFPSGILGFEDLKDYALMDAPQAPFYWLQSLEMPEIAFVLIDPRIFRPDYRLEVDPAELEEIGLDDGSAERGEILVFAIITIPEDASQMTANLQGPIIISKDEKIGRQAISTNPRWQVRHGVLKELSTVG